MTRTSFDTIAPSPSKLVRAAVTVAAGGSRRGLAGRGGGDWICAAAHAGRQRDLRGGGRWSCVAKISESRAARFSALPFCTG